MRYWKRDPNDVLRNMAQWRKFGSATSVRARTKSQQAYDSGVFAAAEFARRVTGDERLAVVILEMSTPIVAAVEAATAAEEKR